MDQRTGPERQGNASERDDVVVNASSPDRKSPRISPTAWEVNPFLAVSPSSYSDFTACQGSSRDPTDGKRSVEPVLAAVIAGSRQPLPSGDRQESAGAGRGGGAEKEQFRRKAIGGFDPQRTTIRQWCAEHRYSEPAFYAWRREEAHARAVMAAAIPFPGFRPANKMLSQSGRYCYPVCRTNRMLRTASG